MLSRLTHYWVYGGFLSGILLLLLLPELARHWSVALLAVFVQLPLYMLHQYEEHDNDRFRQFFNQKVGGGQEVLSLLAVFVINLPCVWGGILLSFYLAAYVSLGLGLIAAYLTLVNALIHIVMAVVSRGYNPGLATAVLLFLPSSTLAIGALQETGQIAWYHHAIGLAVTIGGHVAIVAYALAVKRG